MSRFRAVLLAVGGLAIVAVAFLTWRARQVSGSPLASLRALADGARARDRPTIEQYLDLQRTAESVVDEARATALALGDSSSTDEGTRTLLVATLEQNIWTTLLDPAEAGRFHGITDVQQQGDTSRVGVRVRLEDGDSAALVHLRMERAAGHWRVIGVEGLGPYMRAGFERRRGRAYEAEMRSDLRNMMAAEEAYFAEHATYTPALGALSSFSPSPGVSIEILEANRAGWRAVARHQAVAAECRVAVGASVPPGDLAREVKCSRGG